MWITKSPTCPPERQKLVGYLICTLLGFWPHVYKKRLFGSGKNKTKS